MRMKNAFAQTPAIWAQRNSSDFQASGLNITLLQQNVSNAFKVEGVGFELVSNVMNQVGPCLYLGMLVIVMASFDPATHVSTGLHQPAGPCYVESTDITGVTRHKYLCVSDFQEDYTFACTTAPDAGSSWYTICGQAHAHFGAFVGGVAGLGLSGMLAFIWLCGAMRPRQQKGAQPLDMPETTRP